MNHFHSSHLSLVAVLLLAACANEPTEDISMTAPNYIEHDGIALDGIDPVSYLNGAPTKGRADLELTWSDRRWRFASDENRARFERAPQQYAPQYAGHCSLAMSLGEVSPGSPTAWSVEDGKLYFHNSAITAFLFKYLPGRMRAADQRWSTLSGTTQHPRHPEATDGKASL